MDVISHGLWGGIVLGRKNKRNFLLAFLFGIMPDIFSFGILTLLTWLGIQKEIDWSAGMPPMSAIPQYVHTLYNITHSLIIFAVVFGLVFLITKKPIWVMLAWPLHILLDIFTHSLEFFPTPFLWPIANYYFNGINWSSPYIFFTNWLILIILYIWFAIVKLRKKKVNSF
jgi:hypothetical protein